MGSVFDMGHPSEDVYSLLAVRVWSPGDGSVLKTKRQGPQWTFQQWDSPGMNQPMKTCVR